MEVRNKITPPSKHDNGILKINDDKIEKLVSCAPVPKSIYQGILGNALLMLQPVLLVA